MPSPVPAPTRDATPTSRGLVNTVAQTFSGIKTFLEAVRLAIKTTGTLPAGGVELEGQILYNTTTKRMVVHDGTVWKPLATVLNEDEAVALEAHIASTTAHDAANITYYDSTVMAQLDALVEGTQDLISNLNGIDGATLVGVEPEGSLSGSTVKAQLVNLDDQKVAISALAANTGTTMVSGQAKTGMTWYQLNAGTLKAQLEQLLTHINSARSAVTSTVDLVAVTNITPPTGWLSSLSYAKDCGGWGHVMGDMENDSGSSVSGLFTFTTLPVGLRPNEQVFLQAIVLNISKTPVGTAYCVINPTGAVQLVSGTVPNSNYLSLNFPAFKCS